MSEATKIGKGVEVVRVGIWNDIMGAEEIVLFVSEPVRVITWGAQQGTATSLSNGKFIRHRLHTSGEGVTMFPACDYQRAVATLREYLRTELERRKVHYVNYLKSYEGTTAEYMREMLARVQARIDAKVWETAHIKRGVRF
jgi:hypothetical protein